MRLVALFINLGMNVKKKKNKKKNHGNSNRDIWPTANLSTDVVLILT